MDDVDRDEKRHGNRGLSQRTIRLKRKIVTSERTFDVNTLPPDMRRVYGHLAAKFGEEYGLLFIFAMRTAVELHRAWHMTLLTNSILQSVKDKFGIRMTWNLGVVKCIFRVEDGGYELHRKIPYDYDSEYQDIYYRIAEALVEEKITVHEALIYQTEAKKGVHTAKSLKFLRDFPGRLVLYPFQAATIAVIFFNGKFYDMGVAAVVGLAAGLIEYGLSSIGGQTKVLIDVIVGLSTGIIGGLWYNHVANFCVSSVLLGVLYWFFYGTAFVIGILEIIAGELETGVTRFMAVSIKTFVLSLGASLGLMLSSGGGAMEVWTESEEFCDQTNLGEDWWRIPMYLASSVAVLGQYRLPISQYVRALIVMLAGYEAQYAVFHGISESFTEDNLDTAASNIAGAAAAAVTASVLAEIINWGRQYYMDRLLSKIENPTVLGNLVFGCMKVSIKLESCFGLGRSSDFERLDLDKKLDQQMSELYDDNHNRDKIEVTEREENLFLELIVGSKDLNPWAILMPAVYQLVPGSVIAKLWFHSIFPPPDDSTESTFSSLMVISTSLALGLILGFAVVQSSFWLGGKFAQHFESDDQTEARRRHQTKMGGMYTAGTSADDDPGSTTLIVTEDDEAESVRDDEA